MLRCAFVTVTDYDFFPGTVATVNSILNSNSRADIFVVQNEKRALTEPQVALLTDRPRVRLLGSSAFERPERYINAWELKAYAIHDLATDYDVIAGIDSDCVLCSSVDAEIERCFEIGGFIGGRDGDGPDYDDSYGVYGIATPAHNSNYMSTSLFFCAVTEANRRILQRWTQCCAQAIFNGKGPFPGHGDQGVLNAILFVMNEPGRLELLDNRLWSQHWVYWDSIIDFRGGAFLNLSADSGQQRTFHCGGTAKFWSVEHLRRVVTDHPLQTYPYVWFLAMLFFGECRDWSVDPAQYLPPSACHLAAEMVRFFPQIQQIVPRARDLWNGLSDAIVDRVLMDIPRALSLGNGSMSEVITLVDSHPWVCRYVEIGGYEGGSILTLGVRFANRDIDFYSVESFMGNLDGSMDRHRLPSRQKYIENLAHFPTLRVNLIPGDSKLAPSSFNDASVDFLFIDGCHDTDAVLRDVDAWLPKLSVGAILGGDDFNWESVRRAVKQRLPEVHVMPSGCVWYTRFYP